MNRTIFRDEDFLDFSYNGQKASDLGLIKVNNGKRQDDEILPASKDTTIDVPGSDGVYYLQSKFQQKEFTINFAYDGLKEEDILKIREWLSPKKECPLIFSERPYKYYMAKPKSAPKLSYIAFDDTDGSRVYRGEGTVQFVCYYPWARSVSRFIEDYKCTAQQLEMSGVVSRNKLYDSLLNNEIHCRNNGQLKAPFKFYFKVSDASANYPSIKIQNSNGDIVGQLHLDKNANWNTDSLYLIDSERHLILGYEKLNDNSNEFTYDIEESKGNVSIMNGAIVAGDFFDLPVGESTITVDGNFFLAPPESELSQYFLYDYLYY